MTNLDFIKKALDRLTYCALMIYDKDFGFAALEVPELFRQYVLRPSDVLYKYIDMMQETGKTLDKHDFEFVAETVNNLLESLKTEAARLNSANREAYELCIDYMVRIEENGEFISKLCNFELY